MGQQTKQKTRVLFFAFGESILARRRIEIFTEDPSFEVGVISNFRYDFENAANFYLSDTGIVIQRLTSMSFLRKVLRALLCRLVYLLMLCHDHATTLHECYKWIADAQLTKDYAKDFKPDIIFLQTLIYPCYLSFILSRAIPLMITFWNGDVIWWAQWNGVERLLKKKIILHGVKRATAMTVNSQSAFQACLDYGAFPEKIHLIRYPGVDLSKFKPGPKSDARRKLGITADKVVLCPRGIIEYVNSDVIVESAASVVRAIPDVLFLFTSVWEGPDLAALKRRAAEMGLEKNFIWQGRVNWENMPDYYNVSDVMVSISSNDSLPNSMLEAMACKVPVIMSDIPQIREWVQHDVNGFLVQPRDPLSLANALTRALENKDYLLQTFLDRNYLTIQEQFNAASNAKKIKDLVTMLAH